MGEMDKNINGGGGEAWKVLRHFKSGAESFREGETLAFLGADADTGEKVFRSSDGALKRWALKKGQTDYSGLVFERRGGVDR